MIHFSGRTKKKKSTTSVTSCTLEEFSNGYQVRLVAYNVSYATEKAKKRATSHKERSDSATIVLERARYYLNHPNEWPEYDIFDNNCEHFAFFCKTGSMDNPNGQIGVIGRNAPLSKGICLNLVD